MKKVFICGLTATGKGLMKQLLDGHSTVCMMPFQGFLFKKAMKYDFKTTAVNPRFSNEYRTEYYRQMPFFNIVEGKSVYKIYYDEFIQNIYYDYELNIASYSKKLYGAAGDGVEYFVEFSFDYSQFELDWFEALFGKQVNVSLEKFIDIMYGCFVDNWKNKYIDSNNIETMVAPIQNGIEPIRWFLKNTINSKLLLMERNGVGFSYAVANKRTVCFKKDNIFSDLYKLSSINSLKEYKKLIYSKEISSNPRVLIVDFDKLVLDTRNTMIKVAEFLEIEYEDILTTATLNKVSLETDEGRFTGKINEDPYESLPKNAIDLLEYIYNGPGEHDSKWKQFYLFARASKQKISYQANQWQQKFQRLLEFIKR